MPQKRKINLLSRDYGEHGQYALINKISISLLGIYLLLLSLLFGYLMFLNYQKSNVEQENQQLGQLVQSQKDKESLLLTIKDRLNIAKAVSSQSSPSAADLVNLVVDILPQGVILKTTDADKDGNISLVAVTTSSASVVEFIVLLEEKDLTGVNLNNLALNDSGEYIISLAIKP